MFWVPFFSILDKERKRIAAGIICRPFNILKLYAGQLYRILGPLLHCQGPFWSPFCSKLGPLFRIFGSPFDCVTVPEQCWVWTDPSNNSILGTYSCTKFDEFSENFQTASDPPPYFRKTILRFLLRNFSGCSDPTLFLYQKSATKFFGSEITPPLRKFSENSSNLVQVILPKLYMFIFWDLQLL